MVKKKIWVAFLNDKEAEQSWQIFKETFLRAQELSIPRCRKSVKEYKELAQLNWDLMVKLQSKRKMHRLWKQGQVMWEEYKEAARLCRDGVRKPKAQHELNLDGMPKGTRKASTGTSTRKEKSRRAYPP